MRQPPANLDAEQAILGTLLIWPATWDDVALSAEDFEAHKHRVIFSALGELHRRRVTPDRVTLVALLNEQGLLDAAGGLSYVAALGDDVPSSTNLDHYAAIVARCAARRALITECRRTEEAAYGDVDDFAALVSEHESRVLATTDRASAAGTGIVHAAGDLKTYLASLQALADGTAEPHFGITTGFEMLDEMLSGLQRGLVTGLAARPSHGKTAAALSIALYAAVAGHAVLYNTLEMPDHLLRGRFLSMMSGAPLKACNLKRSPRGKEQSLINRAAAKFAKLPIHVDDDAALTTAKLRSRAKRHKRQHGLDLIIVDYVQLMTPDPSTAKSNPDTQLTKISRDLVIMAKELNVAILALAQLNRGSERHAGGVPRMSDVRGSGCFEQDWRTAILIHRPDLRDPEDDGGKSKGPQKAHDMRPQFIVGKNSEGETGRVPVQFVGERAMFRDLPDEAEGWS